MSYRPYPNRDRALRQLNRHTDPVPAIPVTPALLLVGETLSRMREGARRVLVAQPSGQAVGSRMREAFRVSPPVDEYRLSTRPGVVSGEQ